MSSILFLVPYPEGCAPSQRYRFEQYLEVLIQAGFTYKISAYFDVITWDLLYKKKHVFQKFIGTAIGLLRRLLLLRSVRKYNWIFIHREAIPYGPSWYEWILVKLFRKKIIYDFDDAIWISQKSLSNRHIGFLKSYSKTGKICNLSSKVCAGNSYLANYARHYNTHVQLIPTSINTESYHNRLKQHVEHAEVTIGWTGSHSTLPFLTQVLDAIKELESYYPIKFLVIANECPRLDLQSLVYKAWSKETEVEDLLNIDIGLMPLPNTEWSKGKCGLKALQYMALGIPAVVSPVGVNQHIVRHSVEGFQCKSNSDWRLYIEKLIVNPRLRQQMGAAGRSTVKSSYSVQSVTPDFLSVFSD